MLGFLSFLARLVSRFPRLVLLLCSVLLGISLVASYQRLSFETDVRTLLPNRNEVARTAREALDDFESFDFMLAIVELRDDATTATLIEAAPQIAASLLDPRFIRSVDYRLDSQARRLIEGDDAGADEMIVNLLTDSDWEALRERLSPEATEDALRHLKARLTAEPHDPQLTEDPLGIGEILRQRLTVTSGPVRPRADRELFLSPEGRKLLMILKPHFPATNLVFCRDLAAFLEQTARGLQSRPESWARQVRVGFAGASIDTARRLEAARRDFLFTMGISFAAVFGLFYLAYRRFEVLTFIAIPLLFGLGWTLGLTTALLQRVTIVSAAVLAVLFSLGVDYGIVAYNRFLEEVRRGRQTGEAARTVLLRTGPGLVTGGVIGAMGFLGLVVSEFVGFRELGLVAGLGIFCCLVATLLMVPAMLQTGFAPREDSIRRGRALTLGLPQLADLISRKPRTLAVCGLMLTVFFAMQAGQVRFSDSLQAAERPSPGVVNLQRRIDQNFETPGDQIVAVVEADSLQGALEANDLLYRNLQSWQTRASEKLLTFDSLRTWLPSAKSQRISQEQFILLEREWPKIEARMAAQAEALGLPTDVMTTFSARVRRWIEIAKTQPTVRFETLRDEYLLSLVQRHVIEIASSGRYRIFTQIYPHKGQWTNEVPKVFLEAMSTGEDGRRLPVKFTGGVVLESALRDVIRRDLALTSLFVIVIILSLLFLHFRDMRDVGLALLPLFISLCWTLGVWRLLGLSLDIFTLVALPVIMALGIHSGVHFLERYDEMGRRRMNVAVETTGRAILLTSLVTLFSLGSLATADFAGLRQAGLFVLLGAFANMVAALIFLPAITHLVTRGSGAWEQWSPSDLG